MRASATRCAASWARRSPRRSSGLRELDAISSTSSSSRRLGGITIPSSASSVENAGRLAGSMPPTSAWCARLTAKPSSVRETSVMSGRCVPPVYGSFSAQTSPGAGSCAITAATASGIAPRCTGMCSAWTTILPRSSKSAVEQSRRSLMLEENAARTRAAPISSAIARRPLPITWSSTAIIGAPGRGCRVRPSFPTSPAAPSRSRPRAPRARAPSPRGARPRRARARARDGSRRCGARRARPRDRGRRSRSALRGRGGTALRDRARAGRAARTTGRGSAGSASPSPGSSPASRSGPTTVRT